MSTKVVPRPLKLTAADPRVLMQERYSSGDRARIADLYAAYEEAFLRYIARGPMAGDTSNHLWRSFHVCARMMLDLGCTYWAFTWDRLVAWRAEQERLHADRSPGWQQNWHVRWTETAATLFFLEVLPRCCRTARRSTGPTTGSSPTNCSAGRSPMRSKSASWRWP